ncbi:hypothetical protein ACTVZO_24075 [Streptomyces sp. IBSNAI002]|uniref:hypothetical protein n=1 Tax=Streptomyces sp. IBSNAI002 TaxID=3457500 RepID=UPI003FD66A6F
MCDRIIHSCAQGVRGIDIPDTPWPEPSQDLLERALNGWERFASSLQEASDD